MASLALQATLEALATFPARLEAYYTCIPEQLTKWRPRSWQGIPSERLTAIEQICHIRDIEVDGYGLRVKRTLNEERPVLADIPGEPLAIERDYSRANADEVLAAFREARVQTIALVSGLTDQQLGRVAIFEEMPTTVSALVHFLCSHDNQHLAGLRWLLGKMPTAQSAG